jgi:YD repeat-containing protein
VGNITSKSVGPQGAEETTFYTYDSLNRLIGVDAPNTANDHTYVYDKVGNRLTHNQDGVAHAYAYNVNNQLTEVREGSMAGPVVYTYGYDANGNRLTKRNVDDTTLQYFTYDQKNRVVGMSVPDKSFYFKYDPSNYRIKNDPSTGSGQVSAGGTRNYYLEGEHLEAIYDRDFQLQDQYFCGVD